MQRIIEGTTIGVTKGILPTWLVRSLDQTGFGHIRNLFLAAGEDLESFGHQALKHSLHNPSQLSTTILVNPCDPEISAL